MFITCVVVRNIPIRIDDVIICIINIQPELLLKLKKAVCNISFQINSTSSTGSGFYFYDKPEDLQKGYYITTAHCVMTISNNVKIKTDKV